MLAAARPSLQAPDARAPAPSRRPPDRPVSAARYPYQYLGSTAPGRHARRQYQRAIWQHNPASAWYCWFGRRHGRPRLALPVRPTTAAMALLMQPVWCDGPRFLVRAKSPANVVAVQNSPAITATTPATTGGACRNFAGIGQIAATRADKLQSASNPSPPAAAVPPDRSPTSVQTGCHRQRRVRSAFGWQNHG